MPRLFSYVAILAGACVSALSFQVFIVPQKLATGGIGGLLLLGHYFFGTPIGLLYALANVPLAWWLYRISGWQSVFKTGWGILAFSVALEAAAHLPLPSPTSNPLLATLYAGILNGVGQFIVFGAGGSLGGMAILATILRRLKGWEISRFLFYTDVLIIGLNGFVLRSMEIVLYSWVMSWIVAAVQEKLAGDLRVTKLLRVNSERAEEIARALMDQMHRGVTLYEARGGYTGQRRLVVECILSPSEMQAARELVRQIDPEALLMIVQVADVYGRGFTLDTQYHRVPIWKRQSVL